MKEEIVKNVNLVLNEQTDGKFCAYAVKIPGSYDLLSSLSGYKNIVTANVCTSFKAAQELARFWNECYIKNGTYMYS